ncbi:MAG: dihydrolipoamide acetyltransferase family protein [Acidimicrobiia bacterium]
MDVTMPQLGETVTEGTITRWLKQVGERVEADEPLFEVSTDKVDSEVPAPSGGFVTEILVPEGETVEVGTRLAVVSEVVPAGAAPRPAVPPPAVPPPAAAAPAVPPPAAAAPAVPPPAAAAPAVPTAPEPVPEPVLEPVPEPAGAAAAGDESRLTSPIVRRLVAERGLDPATITGTGPGGRLTRKDVLHADATPPDAPPPAAPPASFPETAPAPDLTPPPAPVPVPVPVPVPTVSRDEVVPFDNIRRRTAEHMVRSKASSAHVYTSVEVDFERIERVRAAYQAEWKVSEGFSLTYLPFIARAFCDTVNEFPRANASVGDDTLVVHHDVHLSIAVDLDFEGLVAPVIRNADGKRLRQIAREVHDLASRARAKRLMPDDVIGGTFTITNPGPFGTYMTLAIINQPQVAILSTDGIKKRPVVVSGPGGDAVAIHHTGMLVLTWDHRAFDGAYAAAFLRAIQTELEERDWEAELD